MVKLKRWAIVIFVLNSNISCQSLKYLKEENQTNKTKTRAIILTQMYPLFRE